MLTEGPRKSTMSYVQSVTDRPILLILAKQKVAKRSSQMGQGAYLKPRLGLRLQARPADVRTTSAYKIHAAPKSTGLGAALRFPYAAHGAQARDGAQAEVSPNSP